MRIIDSHAHVISRDRQRYPLAPLGGTAPDWIDERGIDTGDLLRLMDSAGVDGAVLVQYAAAHGYDNAYVLDSACRHPRRFVAVCALESGAADLTRQFSVCIGGGAVGARLRAPDRGPGLDWLAGDTIWRCASELDVPLAIHLMPHQHVSGIEIIRERVGQFPGIRIVLDHVGNPPWQATSSDFGLDAVSTLADVSNLAVKFATVNLDRLAAAGLEASAALGRLVYMFGADRLMWGSDAPNTPGAYTDMLQRMRAATAQLSAAEQALIFGGTAGRVYPTLKGGPD